MRKVLITGALGQIGTELTEALRDRYGNEQVIATDNVRKEEHKELMESGIFKLLDVTDGKRFTEIVKQYKVDTIVNLAAILSAVGEEKPHLAWHVNMNGLYTVLEVAREQNCSVFTPSSIAAFGPSTPKLNTPQETIQRPNTMYGVTKVGGELLADYYFHKFNVDTRGVRFPGLISYKTLPGGGTTDYAVHIYYEALNSKKYCSFIQAGTKMDMMYMPDAIKAIIQLLEADPADLVDRNAFNVTAMSFDPEEIAAAIRQHIPEFKLEYEVDPVRQAIADSWPDSLDDSAAKEQWGWDPDYNLETMTEDMLTKLKVKLGK